MGAVGDDDGGTDRGAVWILELDGSPLRNGSGTNPLTLGESQLPALHRTWDLTLDCSGHVPGLAVVGAHAAPAAGVGTVAGELLVDLTSPLLFRTVTTHAGGPASFALFVPFDPALISFPLHVQGLCTGAPRIQLSNALDEIIGFQ